MNLVDTIKAYEGFSGTPYIDTEGYQTIGYGTKLPITEYEAQLLLEHRLNLMISELNNKLKFIHRLPQEAKEVLYNMAYQLGVPTLLRFRKTLKAIELGNYKEASKEMLDSRWAKQTPRRAKELSNILAKIDEK